MFDNCRLQAALTCPSTGSTTPSYTAPLETSHPPNSKPPTNVTDRTNPSQSTQAVSSPNTPGGQSVLRQEVLAGRYSEPPQTWFDPQTRYDSRCHRSGGQALDVEELDDSKVWSVRE